MRRRSLPRLALAIGPLLVAIACGGRPHVQVPPAQPRGEARFWTTRILLHGRPLELHLARPRAPVAGDAVVLYASGDGGWFGAAVDMFHEIAGNGYFAVGFSSRGFLKIERPHGALVSAGDLSDEYGQILQEARAALGLRPEAPAVLTGWSRGAAFAVLVGSEPRPPKDLLGVVAIGLAADENLGIADAGTDEDSGDGEASRVERRGAFDTYARIRRLGSVPCAVIQSTHDGYLPAARARELFGPATPSRRFYPVEARNHRFSGGKAAFDAALVDALHWIATSARAIPPVW